MRNVEVASRVLIEIVDEATRQLPLEFCGLLVGRRGRIEQLVRTENIRASRNRFAISPAELAQAIRIHRHGRMEPLGVVHSHPTSPALPSRRDIEEFGWSRVSYWIVSLLDRGAPVIGCFRRQGEALVEWPYTICDSGPE